MHHSSIAEYWAVREKAVIMDLSPRRKYEVTGPDAEELIQLCITRDVKKILVDGIVYTAMCYEHGLMIDDGTLFRLGDTNFRWIGGNDQSGLWLRKKADERRLNVWVRSSTDHHCNLALQGSLSREILKDVIWTPRATHRLRAAMVSLFDWPDWRISWPLRGAQPDLIFWRAGL